MRLVMFARNFRGGLERHRQTGGTAPSSLKHLARGQAGGNKMTDAKVAPQTKSGGRKQTRVGGAAAPAGISWALFEFARNPFFMLIVTYVFPPYFAAFVIGDP